MQIHTRPDQPKPEQNIFFWANILVQANLSQRLSCIAWMNKEGGQV